MAGRTGVGGGDGTSPAPDAFPGHSRVRVLAPIEGNPGHDTIMVTITPTTDSEVPRMPSPRDIRSYPVPQFVALFRKVVDSAEVFLVPCSPAQAASMRGEIYAFRIACERDPEQALALGIPLDDLRKVSFKCKPTGLECMLTSALPIPGLIEQALGTPAPPIATRAQEALGRLMSNLQAPEPDAT